jgi:peptidoglycan-associated lipoprotein
MRISIRGKVLLVGACLMTGLAAWGQAQSPQHSQAVSFDLAATYSVERAQQAPGMCGCFWFKGGGMDVTANFWKGLGVTLAVSGEQASAATAGADLNNVRALIGPRYNARLVRVGARRIPVRLFGEALFGRVFAFNSIFPIPGGVLSSKDATAVQTGGGLNIQLSKHFGLRPLQVDYVYTNFPNNASNTQNDVSVSWGASYHFGK